MNKYFAVIVTVFSAFMMSVPACAQFASRDHPYRLQAGDVIEVSYTYTPEYNSTVTLEPDGMVTLKFVGSLDLGNQTIDQATQKVRQLAATKLADPEVSLTLKEYVKPHIVVSGEVNKPGSFDLHGKATALEAIAWSGGFKESAKQRQVLLIRRTQADSDLAETKVIDFKQLTSVKGASEDVELQPNDILIVPKNALGKIEPYIRISSMALSGLYGVALLK